MLRSYIYTREKMNQGTWFLCAIVQLNPVVLRPLNTDQGRGEEREEGKKKNVIRVIFKFILVIC